MNEQNWSYIGLGKDDWYSLKNAVVDASFGKDSRKKISQSVLYHEVSKLLDDYFDNDNKKALGRAASVLTGGGDNPWVALYKS